MVNIYFKKKSTTLKAACISSELKYISLLYQSTWYLVKILANMEVHKDYSKTGIEWAKERWLPEKWCVFDLLFSLCLFPPEPRPLSAFFLSFLLSKVSVETEIHWTELKRQTTETELCWSWAALWQAEDAVFKTIQISSDLDLLCNEALTFHRLAT